MKGVCFPYATDQNQWDYVLSNFKPETIWILNAPEDARLPKGARRLNTAEDLPDNPLVVLAPKEGRFVKGEMSLVDFEHPEDAVYLFGQNNQNLSELELGNRVPDHVIYIPTSDHVEMYSWTAYAVTYWDRSMKHG